MGCHIGPSVVTLNVQLSSVARHPRRPPKDLRLGASPLAPNVEKEECHKRMTDNLIENQEC